LLFWPAISFGWSKLGQLRGVANTGKTG
jgi:hypothetical protein